MKKIIIAGAIITTLAASAVYVERWIDAQTLKMDMQVVQQEEVAQKDDIQKLTEHLAGAMRDLEDAREIRVRARAAFEAAESLYSDAQGAYNDAVEFLNIYNGG